MHQARVTGVALLLTGVLLTTGCSYKVQNLGYTPNSEWVGSAATCRQGLAIPATKSGRLRAEKFPRVR